MNNEHAVAMVVVSDEMEITITSERNLLIYPIQHEDGMKVGIHELRSALMHLERELYKYENPFI